MTQVYKKIRFSFRFLWAILGKYYLVIILGAILGAVSFLVIPEVLGRLPKLRTTKHIAVVGRYTLSDLPLVVQKQISLGLTTITSSNLPASGIATAWTVSEDGKEYTFELPNNLTWHDGSTIKSTDISYKFRDVEVNHPDDTHLVFKLQNPYSPLPSVVSKPIFKANTNRPYIGLGNYKVSNFKRNGPLLDSLLLSPVDTSNRLPKLKYYFYATQAQAKTALKLGLVEEILELTDPGELTDWPNLKVTESIMEDRYIGIFFNTQDPFLSGPAGKNLRLALSYATNKSSFKNRATGPIIPSSWAYNPDIKKYDYDPTRAKDLIKKVEKLPDKLVLTTVPAYLSLAEQIKSDWEAAGVSVEITASPDIPETFQALLIAQAIPIDPDQYNLWHSTQVSTNLTQLKNPRIDKLLEDGRVTRTLPERKKIYQDFQRFLLEEAPAIFLEYPKSYTVSK